MRISESGYVAKLVSAFVAAAPTEMYHYASEHAKELISNLANNMMYLGTCDVVRFLLDIPLIGTTPSPPPTQMRSRGGARARC